jgi:multiple sugar transport system permease protein
MASTVAPPKATTIGVARPVRRAWFSTLLQAIVKHRVSYFLLLPFLIPFLIFVVYPIGASAYLSLTEFKGTTAPSFIAFENFRELLSIEFKMLPQAIDKASGEAMFRCGSKQVPQSGVEAAKASGSTCTVALARPSEVMTKGYQEISRIALPTSAILIAGSDNRFWTAIWNTIRYSLVVVPMAIAIGLALAVALQRQNVLNYVLRTIFFLPSVTATLAVITIWRYVFNSESYGLANAFLVQFGVPKITFLANASWTLPVMIIFALWGGAGYNMILFLAGLQSIPAELYESAAIDGASPQQRFWRITLPLLRPTMLYVLITGTITAFQVFEVVYVMFGASTEHVGGVLDSGLTVVPYLYDQGFRLFKLGYASAVAWILFLLIFVLTLINLRIGHVNEDY